MPQYVRPTVCGVRTPTFYSNFRAFSRLSLRVLFITTITLAVNSDEGSDWGWWWLWCSLIVCAKYAIWLILSSTYHFWQTIHCSLQTDQESRAVAGKPHVRCRCKMRYVSKFTAASRGFPCSCSWRGDPVQKSLRLHRYKSNRDEFWQYCSSCSVITTSYDRLLLSNSWAYKYLSVNWRSCWFARLFVFIRLRLWNCKAYQSTAWYMD